MLDRQKIEAVLARRFPGAAFHQVAAAANAIMGLDDEWEEILEPTSGLGLHHSAVCGDLCRLARELDQGAAFRLFRRRDI